MDRVYDIGVLVMMDEIRMTDEEEMEGNFIFLSY